MSDDAPPPQGSAQQERAQRVRPVDLRDFADFDPERARRVRVLASDVLTIDLWCLQPDQSTDVLHHEDTDVVYTVLGGNAWFVTDEGELGLGPLGAMLVPAGVVHGFDNRTADPLIVVASGSPPDVPADEVTTDEPVDDASEAVFRPGDELTLRERIRRSLR